MPLGALLLATVTAALLTPGAQPPATPGSYRQLVDAYRDGSRTAETDLPRLFPDPSRIVDAIVDPASTWSAADLTAAAMLHTDACLRLIREDRGAAAAVHLGEATRLLQAANARDPESAQFARRWRDAVAGLLHAFGAVDLASDLRARMTIWLPESAGQVTARAAFAKGMTAEIQAAVAGPLSGPPPRRIATVPPEALSALREAANDYAAAVGEDPADLEAALHLGRTRLLDGADADADRWLTAASASPNRAVRYLALLFLGAEAERHGRFADAETRYRSALESYRWGQSAPLALSHLLMRAGRDTDARDVLGAALAMTRGRVVEPLWTYLSDPEADLGPTLDELRAEVWR